MQIEKICMRCYNSYKEDEFVESDICRDCELDNGIEDGNLEDVTEKNEEWDTF
jgi:ribosomal protein L40E